MKSIKQILTESLNLPFSKDNVKVKYGTIKDLSKMLRNGEYRHMSSDCGEFNKTNARRIALAGRYNEQAMKGRTATNKAYAIRLECDSNYDISNVPEDAIISVVAIYMNYAEGTYYEASDDLKDTNKIPLKVD